MIQATITSKGQLTLPKKVRDLLGLEAGDRVGFVLEDKNKVILMPNKKSALDLGGILRRPHQRRVSIKEMNAGITRRMARKYR